jgi:hypothetical protein
MSEPLPPCGLYRTTEPIGAVPAGRLVYFHNHGDPGPGVYLPRAWTHNRAEFDTRGTTLPDPALAVTLEPLAREGLYVVREPFWCCEKRCREFTTDELVQLGYNGNADAILFVPELIDGQLALPTMGTKVERERLDRLQRLKIPEARAAMTH